MPAPALNPKAIRADIVARLIAANTAAGNRIYDSRRIAEQTDEMPVIAVLTVGSREKQWPQHGLMYKRTERMQIEGAVSGGATDTATAGVLDDLEEDIRDALFGDAEWLGAFETVEQVSCEKMLTLQGRERVSALVQTIEVTYTTTYVPTLQDDLDTVAVTTEPTDPDGADVTEREFPIVVAP